MGRLMRLPYQFSDASIYNVRDLNSSFAVGTLKVMYTGKNRNGSFISRQAVERALPSLYNVPIVCHWDYEAGEIGSHDIELVAEDDGSLRIRNLTEPCGVVPESARFSFVKEDDADGVTHEYLVIDGVLLWKRQDVFLHITEDLGGRVDHSMEIHVLDGDYDEAASCYKIQSFEFTALCLLESAEPCFEGSELVVFSAAMEGMKEKMEQMMADLKNTFSSVSPKQGDDITDYSEKGGEVLDRKKDLLKRYGLDAKKLGLHIESMTYEELVAALRKGGHILDDILDDDDPVTPSNSGSETAGTSGNSNESGNTGGNTGGATGGSDSGASGESGTTTGGTTEGGTTTGGATEGGTTTGGNTEGGATEGTSETGGETTGETDGEAGSNSGDTGATGENAGDNAGEDTGEGNGEENGEDTGENGGDENGDNETYALAGQVQRELIRSFEGKTINTCFGEMPRYWFVDFDYDICMVYCEDAEDWALYGFAYHMDGDRAVVDFDSKKRMKYAIVEYDCGTQASAAGAVFRMMSEKFQTASESANVMQTELEKLKAFKASIEKSQADSAKENLFSEFADLEDVDAFAKLRESADKYSVEELEDKCYAIRGRYKSYSKATNERRAAKLRVPASNMKDEPYGGAFIEYGVNI